MTVNGVTPADRAASCGIAVMAKASRAGRTKTRLSPPLTGEQAARLNTAFLQDVAANLLNAAALAPLTGYMAYGPPGEAGFFRFLPTGIGLFEAWEASFGETLTASTVGLLARGHSSACVLNADSPTLPPAILVEATHILAEPGEHIVLGPSTDGGYYFLGMKTLHLRLFEDIAWSTEQVMRQTLARAGELGLEVRLLPEWYDVDDAASLATLRGELFDATPFGTSGRDPALALHTRRLLRELQLDLSSPAEALAGTAE